MFGGGVGGLTTPMSLLNKLFQLLLFFVCLISWLPFKISKSLNHFILLHEIFLNFFPHVEVYTSHISCTYMLRIYKSYRLYKSYKLYYKVHVMYLHILWITQNHLKSLEITWITLKLDSSHLWKKDCVICSIESPLKMMKNTLFSSWKLFSFSRYLRFCLDFLIRLEKRLD